ncbi:MAG: hypothetical protein ABSF29_13915 [Tepidisphaeraceae bacterium]|jgi:hypothetical protein
MALTTMPAIWMTNLINWVAGNPAWSVAILLVPALLAASFAPRLRRRAGYRWALAIVSGAGILLYAQVVVSNCRAPQFDDHIEPQVAAVGYLLMNGVPIYQPPGAAVQYTMVYGPFTYLSVDAYYWLMGPSIFAAKLSGAVSALAGVALLLWALKRIGTWWTALACTGLATALYYTFGTQSFWCRADSHEVFMVSLGLLALTLVNPWAAAALVGISAGICINLKFTAAAYYLPIGTAFILRYRRAGPAALAVAVSIAAAAAPFLLPAISLENYLAWVREVSHHPLSAIELRNTLSFAGWMAGLLLILGFPSIWSKGASEARAVREWYWTAAGLGGAMLITLPFASKEGAGSHHLMPLVPILMWLVARAWSIGNSKEPTEAAPRLTMRHLLVVPVLVVSMFYAGAGGYVIGTNPWTYNRLFVALLIDLRRIQDATSGHTVEMGVGGDQSYFLTNERPVLVFAGNPYHLDAAAAMDSAEAQDGLPAATADLCRSGLADFVLIPRGDAPFTMASWYPGHAPVFSPEFVRAFHDNYRIRFSSIFFDVYGRKPIASADLAH